MIGNYRVIEEKNIFILKITGVVREKFPTHVSFMSLNHAEFEDVHIHFHLVDDFSQPGPGSSLPESKKKNK
jgi:hypothetical protein